MSTPGIHCAEFATQAGEHLFATAARADVWLLLEYAEPWESDAFESSRLSQPVKNRLTAALKTIPRARLQLIRQPRREQSGPAFYLAVSREPNMRLYRFRLSAYADLMRLDLPAVVSGDARYDGNRVSEPLILVCAHGSRDACCARLGVPVYNALAAQPGWDVWLASHVGGHRFAANVICLPHGIVYGRVAPTDAVGLVERYRAGEIDLDYLRGRSNQDAVLQAADYFFRRHTGAGAINACHATQTTPLADNHWRIEITTADGERRWVELARDKAAIKTYTSCRDEAPSEQDQFRLIGIE